MARADQLVNHGRAYKARSACNENTHFLFLLCCFFGDCLRVPVMLSCYASVRDALDMDKAFTRVASRLQMLSVICRHSRVEEGRSSVATNSCSHSSADISASSGPNNSVTALNNAVNSCSAMVTPPAQSRS